MHAQTADTLSVCPAQGNNAGCKTVGLAYVGSNPTPATTYSRRSKLVSASFPSLSRKRSGQLGAFARLRSFCRSARRAKSVPRRDACATENTRRSLRSWTRCRRCSGCGGPQRHRSADRRLGPASQGAASHQGRQTWLRKVTICSEAGVVASRRTPIRAQVSRLRSTSLCAPATDVRGRGSRPEPPDVMGRIDVRSADLEQVGRRAVAVSPGWLRPRRWRAASPVPAWSIESLRPR